MMDEPGRFFDVTGAAAYIGVSTSYLFKLVSRRRIPYIKLGRLVRFDRQQLDRWMSRRQVLPRDWNTGGAA
ncbi:MAG: excisionase family DNA-binding protein [Candidatus Aminicenantales bacterium]